MNSPLQVSVIIPTYNSAASISSCLDTLINQTYPSREIIVVDDGSTDKTIKIVSKFKGIKLIKQTHLGPGPARNKGVKFTKGKILVFVDADMTFHPRFINQLVKPILLNKSSGTFTKDEFVANWGKSLARFWNYALGLNTNRRLPENYPSRAPVFRAILASEFNRVGGFDPIGYTDDWSLSRKLNYPATLAEGAICYHRNPETLPEVWRQASWIGKRRYKFGIIGKFLSLLRASFPFSFLIGLVQAIQLKQPLFFFFRLYFDLAIFTAIISSFFTHKNVK